MSFFCSVQHQKLLIIVDHGKNKYMSCSPGKLPHTVYIKCLHKLSPNSKVEILVWNRGACIVRSRELQRDFLSYETESFLRTYLIIDTNAVKHIIRKQDIVQSRCSLWDMYLFMISAYYKVCYKYARNLILFEAYIFVSCHYNCRYLFYIIHFNEVYRSERAKLIEVSFTKKRLLDKG